MNGVGFIAEKAAQGAKGVYGYVAEVGLKVIFGGAAEVVTFGAKTYIKAKLAILGGKVIESAEGQNHKIVTNVADELIEGVKDFRLGLRRVGRISLAILFPVITSYSMWPIFRLEDSSNSSVSPAVLVTLSSFGTSLYLIYQIFQESKRASSPEDGLINRCFDRTWSAISSNTIMLSPVLMPSLILGSATAMYQVNGCSAGNQNHMCDTASTVGTVGVGFIVVGAGIFLYNTQKFNKSDLPISNPSIMPITNSFDPSISHKHTELEQKLDGIHREIRGKHHQIDEKIRKMREMQKD